MTTSQNTQLAINLLRHAAALGFVLLLVASAHIIALPLTATGTGPRFMRIKDVSAPLLVLLLLGALLLGLASGRSTGRLGFAFIAGGILAAWQTLALHLEAPARHRAPEGQMRPDTLTFTFAYSLGWLLLFIGATLATAHWEERKAWWQRLMEGITTLTLWIAVVTFSHYGAREVITGELLYPRIYVWFWAPFVAMAAAYIAGVQRRRAILYGLLALAAIATLVTVHALEFEHNRRAWFG